MKTLDAISVALAMVLGSASIAAADALTKEQCIDAHSRGQDAREQGKLSLARKVFLTCAQSSCPAAVQGDCARFADDLTGMQPTIVLVARDSNGNDLPNTTVYIDGALIVTNLDGRPIDIDPGNHTVKFQNGTKEEVLTVVIGSGEKGRTVAARFGAAAPAATAAPAPSTTAATVATKKSGTRTTHPPGSLAVLIGGAGLAVAGTAIALWGISKVPDNCSLSTNECTAPPGDPVFDEASSGARTMNIGIIAGGIGVAAFAAGVVWYFGGAKTTKETPTQVAPVVTNDGAGFAVSGRF
jgi:hypothetical protein